MKLLLSFQEHNMSSARIHADLKCRTARSGTRVKQVEIDAPTIDAAMKSSPDFLPYGHHNATRCACCKES